MNRAIGDADPPLTMQTLAGVGGTITAAIILFGANAFGAEDFVPSLPTDGLELGLIVLIGACRAMDTCWCAGFPAGSRLGPRAVPVFRDHLGDDPRLCAVPEFPDAVKWLGIAIIIGSGLYIIWRERVVAEKRQAKAD